MGLYLNRKSFSNGFSTCLAIICTMDAISRAIDGEWGYAGAFLFLALMNVLVILSRD